MAKVGRVFDCEHGLLIYNSISRLRIEEIIIKLNQENLCLREGLIVDIKLLERSVWKGFVWIKYLSITLSLL